MMKESEFKWWQKEVVYQIYPRSFMDSDGDGVGDLAGIEQKLDYLQQLGVGAIWISPIYPSPMADFGYDVSDYTGIHPLFGNMEKFDQLLKEVHEKGMKMILDLVPNHTSNEHPWFQESRKSRTNPKRDWYIWKDPAADGGPPNNWLSEFGGDGWELDEQTGQYYYHAYLKEQPDLNWRNPEVHEAVFKAMRFWLDKGVDGFRVDVMWHMIKDDQFRDNPPNPDYSPETMSPYRKLIPAYSTDQPEVHEVVRKMRQVTDEYTDRVLIGEIYLPVEKLIMYYGEGNKGAQLPFNFQLIGLPWDAAKIFAAVNDYEGALPEGAWPNWVMGNHDKSRLATRVGKSQARVAAMLLLSLRGTPTMYYGEEIGMEDVPIPPEQVQDPHEKNVPGKNLGRDPQRTPMQWDDSSNAGFTTGDPWLPVGNYGQCNVAGEWQKEDSLLSLYRKLLKLRNTEPALHIGDYFPYKCQDNLLSYFRSDGEKTFLILLNLGSSEVTLQLENIRENGICRLGTVRSSEGEEISGEVSLAPDEGKMLQYNNAYKELTGKDVGAR
ncbi:alpha-amylase family glycosyl hydrolase [Zunongwangia sp. F363]|uniref:Alpha-amylase family glycosyl hydrolase n=1 Tax=Autumnicola tepida TaxID=3075595 RepID=A0ABU3CAK5_9FLAO|nr:alpha-amylase family glycosyl hydrolase [Zunongwangia sp. F363]MDT0643075.1 alpha-amylase family glycosyl hydrolase [Zunongwangia sp. F363]